MKSLISFRKCSKYTYLILVYFAFSLLKDCTIGFNNRDHRIHIFNFNPGIKTHLIPRNFLGFLSSFFFGIILYLLKNKIEMKKKGEISFEKQKKLKEEYLGEKGESINLILIIIFIIYSLNELIRSMLYPSIYTAEFWMLEIAFIVLLKSKILRVKIGIHQKITVFVVAGILFLFRIINCALPLTKHNNCGTRKECKNRYLNDNNLFYVIKTIFGNYGYVFYIFLIFTLIAIMRDYSWVKTKYLIDVKTVSLYKIFIFYGLIGGISFIVAGVVLSFISCDTLSDVIEKYNNKTEIYDYYYNNSNIKILFGKYRCRVKDYDDGKKELKLYYDNLFVFFDFFKDFDKDNRVEIFVLMPLYMISQGMVNFSEIMMISHFDPNIILISKNFYYFVQRLIQFWVNDADEKYLTHVQFITFEIEEIISLIANLIYLEIIELRFCNLNYDTKRLIEKRMDLDYNIMEEECEEDDNNNISVQTMSFSEM